MTRGMPGSQVWHCNCCNTFQNYNNNPEPEVVKSYPCKHCNFVASKVIQLAQHSRKEHPKPKTNEPIIIKEAPVVEDATV